MFNKVYVVKENHLKIILKKIFNQFTCVCLCQLSLDSLGTVADPNPDPRTRAHTQITHHTSLMRFNGLWYYYNDMQNDGRLVPIPPGTNLRDFVASKRLSITAVIYFRR